MVVTPSNMEGEGPNGRPSVTTGRQRVLGSVRVRERRRAFWKSPFAPAREVGRVPRPLCRTALSAEPSVTRIRAEQCERAAELGRLTVERSGSRCRGAAREARRVNSSRTTDSVDDRNQVKAVIRASICLSLVERV